MRERASERASERERARERERERERESWIVIKKNVKEQTVHIHFMCYTTTSDEKMISKKR